jgi:DNA replication protein DnaD
MAQDIPEFNFKNIDDHKQAVLNDEFRRHYAALVRAKQDLLFTDKYLATVKHANEEEKKLLIERMGATKEQAEKDIIMHQAHVDAILEVLKEFP